MKVWATDLPVVCVHPMGPMLTRLSTIRESWKEVFSHGPGMAFEVANRVVSAGEDLSVHWLHERISHGPGMRRRGLVLATNVYRRTEKGWRMVAHHASPGGALEHVDTPPQREIH